MSEKEPHAEEIEELVEVTDRLHATLQAAVEMYPNSESVRFPLHAAYWPTAAETPAPNQQAAIDWRTLLADRNRSLRAHFVWRGEEHKLTLFELAPFGERARFGEHLNAQDCLQALQRERGLLEREWRTAAEPSPPRENTQSKAATREDRAHEIGKALQAARERRGDNQEGLAEKLECSASTVSRIERGKQQPRSDLRKRIVQYINKDAH